MQRQVKSKLERAAKALGWAFGAFCAFLGLVVVIVSLTPLNTFWAVQLAQPWNDDRGDVLIVLSGAALDQGVPGINSYWRCFYGALAWRSGGFSEVLITGDNVVEPMKQLMVAMGVPAGAIEVEAQSRNTYENAIHSRSILLGRPGKKVLLTSDYQIFRARHAFSKAGLLSGFWVVPDVTKRSTSLLGRWPAFLDLVQESAKIIYYYFKDWI